MQVAIGCDPEAHCDHRYLSESPSGSLASARKETVQGSTTSPHRGGWQPSSPVTRTIGGRFDGGEEEEVVELDAVEELVTDVVGIVEPVGGGALSPKAPIRSRPNPSHHFFMGSSWRRTVARHTRIIGPRGAHILVGSGGSPLTRSCESAAAAGSGSLSAHSRCGIFGNGREEINVTRLADSPRPSTNATELAECELVRAGDVIVGRFRSVPEDARFPHAGAITRHCFVFPRRGVWIQHDGQEAFVADPTRVTLYNPRQAYERRALDPKGDHSDWITVSDAIAREVVGAFDPAAADSPTRVFQHPYAPAGAGLYLAQRRLHQYVCRNREPDLLLVEESAIDIFARTISGLYAQCGAAANDSPPLTPHHRDTVEQVCAYLNHTLTTNLSLTAISREVGASVFHLCRIFRRGTGLTVHAYRHHLRLRRALEALEHPDMDLLSLALDLGYSGHSHFTAAFRRRFGLVPSKLRDDMKAMEGPASPQKWAAENPRRSRTARGNRRWSKPRSSC